MNAKQRYNARRAAEHREMKAYCKKIDRAFSRLSEGCSERVSRAISLAGTRQKEVEGGSVCLPEVALFAAGHRKSNNVTAR
ncbi:transcriptional antitermination N peptide [Enterobacter kobei]